mgnify:CR=1 FL=1
MTNSKKGIYMSYNQVKDLQTLSTLLPAGDKFRFTQSWTFQLMIKSSSDRLYTDNSSVWFTLWKLYLRTDYNVTIIISVIYHNNNQCNILVFWWYITCHHLWHQAVQFVCEFKSLPVKKTFHKIPKDTSQNSVSKGSNWGQIIDIPNKPPLNLAYITRVTW